MANRLTPDDWISAGFRALATSGPDALKAEKLARGLGTSKGSFYWHFKDVPAFHAAMLALWKSLAFTDIVDALAPIPTPQGKLRALAQLANDGAPDRFGGMLVEPAIRAWSLRDADVAKGVAEVDAARIAYVGDLLDACGKPRSGAVLFYGAYVGLDDLQSRGQPETAGALVLLLEQLLA